MLVPPEPLARPELKAILATKEIPEVPESPELPVPLVRPDQLVSLALLALTERPLLLAMAC
jgi:hypothetical protein